MDQRERRKVTALYVFEAVIVTYLIGIIIVQSWIVYGS